MNKFMRIIVFFDLPVKSKLERKEAAKFRKFLLDDGYHMVQYSVYSRICNGMDSVNKHASRLNLNIPDKGSIRMMEVTEKQYEDIKIILGSSTIDDTSA